MDATTLDMDRFVAVASRLASNHSGERDAAASIANRMLAESGLTWADVLASPDQPRAPAEPPPAPRRPRTPAPAHVVGILRIAGRRSSRGGRILTVAVTDADGRELGPFDVFATSDVLYLERRAGLLVSGSIHPPPHGRADAPAFRPSHDFAAVERRRHPRPG